jgi:hypothetical protein
MTLITSLCEGLRREIIAGILVTTLFLDEDNSFFTIAVKEKVLRKNTNQVPLPKVYICFVVVILS